MDEFDLLRKRIRELMNSYTDDVSTGACSDWADYKHSVGIITGLALAERELLDLREKLNTDSGE